MHFFVPKKLPPPEYRQIIEDLAVIISRPDQKLKLMNQAISAYHKIHWTYKLVPPLAKAGFKKIILEKAEQIQPESLEKANNLFKRKIVSPPHPVLWRLYKSRRSLIAAVLLVFAYWTAELSLPALKEMISDAEANNVQYLSGKPLPVSPIKPEPPFPGEKPNYYPDAVKKFPEYIEDPVWLVEKKSDMEIYSNGLHVITSYTVDNVPRVYYQFRKNSSLLPAETETTGKIAGIVFHSSESDLFPFRPDMNLSLKKKSMLLIKYIRRTTSYNYVIDRFGQVYRIVREDHTAYHAGNSVWADDSTVYLNLNNAFIGICFEGKNFETAENLSNGPDSPKFVAASTTSINSAQLASAEVLTNMLRYKYKIPQRNCVTHGIASVSPENFLIGYHLDLAHGFPFNKLGLNNKYMEPIPAITEFGFSYDTYFKNIFKGELWPGITASENTLTFRAKNSGLSSDIYTKRLNRRYDVFFKWQKKQQEKMEEELANKIAKK